MRFDFYGATVPEPPEVVLGTLLAGQDLASVYETRGLHSYTRGAELRRGDRVLARCFWGGVNGEDSTHVQGSGAETPWLVERVRERWPVHRVSRADACEDWSGPKLWRRLSKLAIRVACEHGVSTRTAGDWIRAREGRTLYIGGRTSYVQCRIYEKGKQLGVDPDWVRLEAQVRPAGVGKSALAAALPGQLMESTAWTRDLARCVGMPELDALRVRDPWIASDDERALSFCVQQYGAVLGRKAALLGGWAELGTYLGGQLATREKQRRH